MAAKRKKVQKGKRSAVKRDLRTPKYRPRVVPKKTAYKRKSKHRKAGEETEEE